MGRRGRNYRCPQFAKEAVMDGSIRSDESGFPAGLSPANIVSLLAGLVAFVALLTLVGHPHFQHAGAATTSSPLVVEAEHFSVLLPTRTFTFYLVDSQADADAQEENKVAD